MPWGGRCRPHRRARPQRGVSPSSGLVGWRAGARSRRIVECVGLEPRKGALHLRRSLMRALMRMPLTSSLAPWAVGRGAAAATGGLAIHPRPLRPRRLLAHRLRRRPLPDLHSAPGRLHAARRAAPRRGLRHSRRGDLVEAARDQALRPRSMRSRAAQHVSGCVFTTALSGRGMS